MGNKSIKLITEDDSFNLGVFIEEVKSSSKNSRIALISLILVTFFVLMTLVNTSDRKYNWYKDRKEMALKVFYSIRFENELKQPLNASFIETISKIETQFPNDKKYFTAYSNSKIKSSHHAYKKINFTIVELISLSNKASFNERKKKYEHYLNTIEYCSDRAITNREDLKQLIIDIIKNKRENIDLVKVPILGIAFDINYLGVYSGLIILLMIWLLFAAMNREHVNTKITFKKAWSESHFNHFIFYEFMSMSQVLHEPKKLFEYRKFSGNPIYKFAHNALNNQLFRLFLYGAVLKLTIYNLYNFYQVNWDILLDHLGWFKFYFFMTVNYLVCGYIIFLVPFIKKGVSNQNRKIILKELVYQNDNPTFFQKTRNSLMSFIEKLSIRITKDSNSEIFFNNKIELSYLEVMRLISFSLPLLIYFLVFLNDIRSATTGELLNCVLTYQTIFIESILICLILFYVIKVNTIKIQITDLWTNRAITFNFKYILGAIFSMEKKFNLDTNSPLMIQIYKFEKRFPDIEYNNQYQAEETLASMGKKDRKLVNTIFLKLSNSGRFISNSKMNSYLANSTVGTNKEKIFNKLLYILSARMELYNLIKFGREYKSMGTYADDNKPLELKTDKEKRILYIKEMCLISILEIIVNKRIENSENDDEWSYQDKKMATIELRNHINKILSLDTSDIDKKKLSELLIKKGLKRNEIELKYNEIINYFWLKLEASYIQASKNNIANNSFYRLFDEIEIELKTLDVAAL